MRQRRTVRLDKSLGTRTRTETMRHLFAICALLAWFGPASADDLEDAKARAVKAATLAAIAPDSCDGLETNKPGVAAFLGHAQVTPDELKAHYHDAAQEAADAFKQSYSKDRDAACQEVWTSLGDDGLGLVNDNDGD